MPIENTPFFHRYMYMQMQNTGICICKWGNPPEFSNAGILYLHMHITWLAISCYGTVGAKVGKNSHTRGNPSKTVEVHAFPYIAATEERNTRLQLSENHQKLLENVCFRRVGRKSQAPLRPFGIWNPLKTIGKPLEIQYFPAWPLDNQHSG